MPSILIVAHAPLASSLLAVARHAFADCSRQVAAVDVPAAASLEEAEQQIEAALATMPDRGEVLVLADAFGATPSNAALKVASHANDGFRRRVVTGVNVPMLWRTLCYGHLPLDELMTRAVDGARQGIMQVASPRPQNQPNPLQPPAANGPDANSDQ